VLVNRETIAKGEHVTIESDERPYSEEERRIVQGQIDRIYSLFLERVGQARGLSKAEVHPIAAGRVWTGRQALERKLVDELGGVDAAVRKARSLAGLKPDTQVRVVRTPRRAVPPAAMPSLAAYTGYLLAGISLVNRAWALAVMDFVPEDS
jgi:protease IV